MRAGALAISNAAQQQDSVGRVVHDAVSIQRKGYLEREKRMINQFSCTCMHIAVRENFGRAATSVFTYRIPRLKTDCPRDAATGNSTLNARGEMKEIYKFKNPKLNERFFAPQTPCIQRLRMSQPAVTTRREAPVWPLKFQQLRLLPPAL